MEQELYSESTEQASESSYKEYLLDRFKLMSDIAITVRKSYIKNQENRDSHVSMISIAVELWNQISPKMDGTPLETQFKNWIPFVLEPRLFFEQDYENMVWLFIYHIRVGFEHLGLTKIE